MKLIMWDLMTYFQILIVVGLSVPLNSLELATVASCPAC